MEPKDIAVELNTGQGPVFIGDSSSVEMRTDDGTLLLIPAGNTYMSMTRLSTLTLRCGTDLKSFKLKNATAGFHGNRLMILAEEIHPIVTAYP
jgi:hypothetical protein